MNHTTKVLLWTFVILVLISFTVYKGCSYLLGTFKKGIKAGIDSEYVQSAKKHISFETIVCENLAQWDTIEARLDQFFIDHPEFRVPDSLEVSQLRCENCEIMEKVLYFKEAPQEFYIISFDKDGYNHIDWIYQYRDGKEFEIATDTIGESEKERVRTRLKSSMLDSIDWNIKNIFY